MDVVCLANHVSLREQIDSSTINDFGAEGVEEVFSRGNRIVSCFRCVASKPVGSGTSYRQDAFVAANPVGTETPFPQNVLMDGGDDDDGIGNPANYYQRGKDDEEDELGHEANDSSPSALEYKTNGGRSFAQAVLSDAIYVSANPFPIRAGEWQSAGMAPQITSPPKRTPKTKSALCSTSFAPVVMNPPPILDDAVDGSLIFLKAQPRMVLVLAPISSPCLS